MIKKEIVIKTEIKMHIEVKEEHYQKAIKLIKEHRMASGSFLQRHLKISWENAMDIIHLMQSEGLIGPVIGSKPRKVSIK